MKKNFKYAMMIATALVLGFSSCSSDDNDPIEGGEAIEEGVRTYASIKISAPQTQTYAFPTDVTGTDKESKINTVDVFLYDLNGYFKNHKRFEVSASTSVTDGVYDLGVMRTTTGKKQAFTIVNNPVDLSTTLQTTDEATFKDNLDKFYTVKKLTEEIQDGKIVTLATDDNFVMSSDVTETDKFTEWDEQGTVNAPSSNVVKLQVKRLVAKVAVVDKLSKFDVAGGTFSEFQFGVGQTNKEIYAAQKIVNGRIEDPNYDNSTTRETGKGLERSVSEYKALNATVPADEAAYKALACVYAPENTALRPVPGDLTYVSVRAKFAPEKFTKKETTGEWVHESDTNTNTDGTFYAIKTDAGNYYFMKENIAKEYLKFEILGKEDTDPLTPDEEKLILRYGEGLSYFTVFINKDQRYDVERNYFYSISVSKINGLGETNEGPINPEDPDTEIGINTDINVEITVLPWTLHTEDHELTPQ